MDAGVPGVLMSTAEIPPAKIEEFHTPINMAKPQDGSNQKVMGVNMATAMVADNPGRAPMQTPIKTPAKLNIKTDGVRMLYRLDNHKDRSIVRSLNIELHVKQHYEHPVKQHNVEQGENNVEL